MAVLTTICENRYASGAISQIMSEQCGKITKIRKLKVLRNTCQSPLARSQAEYYIEVLCHERRETIKNAILVLFSLSYLIFTLCRVFWYYHPEKNPLPETNYTIVDLIRLVYLLPIICAVLWGVRKVFFCRKNRNR